MESRSSADVIYLDFAKAFDKVDHGILIRKLVEIGVNGDVLVWIFEFLTNRQQIVKVSGVCPVACVLSAESRKVQNSFRTNPVFNLCEGHRL